MVLLASMRKWTYRPGLMPAASLPGACCCGAGRRGRAGARCCTCTARAGPARPPTWRAGTPNEGSTSTSPTSARGQRRRGAPGWRDSGGGPPTAPGSIRLDAACAYLRETDGIDSVVISAHAADALTVALWCDARRDAEPAGALILSSPAFGRRLRRGLRIACPVLVMCPAAGRKADQAGRKADQAGRKADQAGRKADQAGRQPADFGGSGTAAALPPHSVPM